MINISQFSHWECTEFTPDIRSIEQCKQCRLRSDCSKRSSLIWVCIVCQQCLKLSSKRTGVLVQIRIWDHNAFGMQIFRESAAIFNSTILHHSVPSTDINMHSEAIVRFHQFFAYQILVMKSLGTCITISKLINSGIYAKVMKE